MRGMNYPALLWVTVLIALLGSFQFGRQSSLRSPKSTPESYVRWHFRFIACVTLNLPDHSQYKCLHGA